METGPQAAASGAGPTTGANVPGTLRDPGALRFWLAIVMTGLAAGIGAALLTALLKEVQLLSWGTSDPSELGMRRGGLPPSATSLSCSAPAS